MTIVATSYRGHRIERQSRNGAYTYTDLWKIQGYVGLRTCNETIQAIDNICGEPIPERVECSRCGHFDILAHHRIEECRHLGFCHTCVIVHGFLKRVDDENYPRINGKIYRIEPDRDVGRFGSLGFGGREHRIRFKDGRTITTHNLWCEADIPAPWKDELPDNADFVTGEK